MRPALAAYVTRPPDEHRTGGAIMPRCEDDRGQGAHRPVAGRSGPGAIQAPEVMGLLAPANVYGEGGSKSPQAPRESTQWEFSIHERG